MTGQTSNHPDIKPFQIFDVLNQTDFERVMTERSDFLPNPHVTSANKLLNFRYSEKEIGIFAKVCDKIVETLIAKGFEKPKVTSIDYINHNNRTAMPWHRHWLLHSINPYDKLDKKDESKIPKTIPYEYFWIVIYYPHKLFDKDYCGKLHVNLNVDDPGYVFDSVPNSLIFHNGLYGHKVTIDKIHPDLVRNACFTHWVCKYDFKSSK